MTRVVAISRQFGSGGARIGRAVAQRLNFRYADREILAEAARALNLDSSDVEGLEERVRSFWERLGELFGQASIGTAYTPPPPPTVSPDEVLAIERSIIRRIAADGNAVIVGRGAAHMLSGPGVVRVFLHAPLPDRVALAMEEYGLTDHAAASSMVAESDGRRAQFVQSITGRNWCDATLYDLCLDTARTDLARAVEVIVDLVENRTPATTPALDPRGSENRNAR